MVSSILKKRGLKLMICWSVYERAGNAEKQIEKNRNK